MELNPKCVQFLGPPTRVHSWLLILAWPVSDFASDFPVGSLPHQSERADVKPGFSPAVVEFADQGYVRAHTVHDEGDAERDPVGAVDQATSRFAKIRGPQVQAAANGLRARLGRA